MDPREEQKSLKEHPLPIEGDDSILPTRIAAIDDEIKRTREKMKELQDYIANLSVDRVTLLTEAIKTGKTDDGTWKIEKETTYGNRVADPKKLIATSKEKWDLYASAIKDKAVQDAKLLLQKAKDGLETSVNLGIADKIFGKKIVDECSTKPESVTWKVVKKE